MPYYEYECRNCGKIEIEHKITEEVKVCPHCYEKGYLIQIKRLISKTSFQLKGNGWAKDGYSKKNR